MQLCGSHELRIASAVRPFGKTLHGEAKQGLAQEDNQVLELTVTQVFIGELYRAPEPIIRFQHITRRP